MNPFPAPDAGRPRFLHCSFTSAALAMATVFGLASPGLAADGEPTPQQLQEQIQRLQRQVQELQAAQAAPVAESGAVPAAHAQDGQDAEARVREDDQESATIPAVGAVQDSPAPFTAGHDGRFILQSADGRFSLSPNFQLQLRSVTNFSDEDGDTLSDIEHGLEMRRVKIGFRGNAFTRDLAYDLKFAFSRDGGGARLENAFIDYTPERLWQGAPANVGIRGGQFKDMTFYEQSVSSSKLMAVDRSLVNQSIGGAETDYIQAVGPLFKGERLTAALFYTDGANSDNTPWQAMQWDYGVAGRVDLVLFGSQKAMDDFTALGTNENSARIGAGFHFAAVGGNRVLWHSVDAQYETAGGLGFFAAYYGRWTEGNLGDAMDLGGLVQVSQLIGRTGWEVFGRYDFVLFEDALLLGGDDQDLFHEFTVGVNRYWRDHKVKLTVDGVYLPSGNPGSHTGIGLRPHDAEFDDQIAIRGQFQLLL